MCCSLWNRLVQYADWATEEPRFSSQGQVMYLVFQGVQTDSGPVELTRIYSLREHFKKLLNDGLSVEILTDQVDG